MVKVCGLKLVEDVLVPSPLIDVLQPPNAASPNV